MSLKNNDVDGQFSGKRMFLIVVRNVVGSAGSPVKTSHVTVGVIASLQPTMGVNYPLKRFPFISRNIFLYALYALYAYKRQCTRISFKKKLTKK